MKLLINTATNYKGGGVQVALSFINECKKYTENQYFVILSATLGKIVDTKSYPNNFKFFNISYRPSTRVFSLKKMDNFFRKVEQEVKPNVVFTTSGPAYWRPNTPHLIGYNLPHYIYQDSPFFKKIGRLKSVKWLLKGRLIRHFYRRDADAIVCQTEDVATRAKEWLGIQNAHVVSNTCSSYYLDKGSFDKMLPEREAGEFRLLTLSSYYPHKNLELINKLATYFSSDSKQNVKFVLSLPQGIYLKKFTEKARKYIHNVGPVPIERGPGLYQECDAMFLPTLLECFSASYPEAMIMEKPIITSELSFARSICSDAALYYEPMNPQDAYEKIHLLLADKGLQVSLIAKGLKRVTLFNGPEERAERYLRICKELIKK